MTNEQVAEAFSRHDFEPVFPYLAEDVRWTAVGGQELVGREAVVGACREAAALMAELTPTVTAFRTLVGPDSVVTESTTSYAEDGEAISVIGSCDVYRFAGDRLTEITSYTVELD